jgi:hypothetical protein
MNSKRFGQFILAFIFTASPALAQSTYEREMQELRKQRDKALAEAAKSVNARYQKSLDDIYRRALHAKDASAEAIKAELETLGPVASLPGAAALTPAKAPVLPKNMFGTWKVVHIGDFRETWEFKEDGTVGITKGTAKIPDKFCTWSKNKDTIEVRYPSGDITALELPIKKGGKLEGTDKGGNRLWLAKEK